MAKLRVLFMGRLRDLAGASECVVDIPELGLSVADLIDLISSAPECSAALRAPSVRLAINQEIAPRQVAGMRLRDGDEIAFLPPYSGG